MRIVDAPGTTDGVAAEVRVSTSWLLTFQILQKSRFEAQHRQNRAEESRLKAGVFESS